MRKWSLSGLFIALCLACCWPSMAQDQGSARGNLGGVVYDSSKSVVPDAEVTITGPIGNQTQITNDQGTFLFSTLIPGSYAVKVHKTGFKAASFQSTEVLINKPTSIEVVLETGDVSEVVEVNAASVTVDISSSSIGADIADTFFHNIP